MLLQILDFDEDYMICNKTNNDIDWRTLEGSPTIRKILWIHYQPFPLLVQMPRRSGSVAKQLNQFMYLEESFKAILKECEIDPIEYDETMGEVDAHLWQKAMEAELESL